MWICVAVDKNAVHYGSSLEYTYVDGENVKEVYFDDETAKELEADGFLLEIRNYSSGFDVYTAAQ